MSELVERPPLPTGKTPWACTGLSRKGVNDAGWPRHPAPVDRTSIRAQPTGKTDADANSSQRARCVSTQRVSTGRSVRYGLEDFYRRRGCGPTRRGFERSCLLKSARASEGYNGSRAQSFLRPPHPIVFMNSLPESSEPEESRGNP